MRKLNKKSRGAKQAPPLACEHIGLRGGIEICLKNAFTGEELIHDSGENVVLYIGRNEIMTRAYGTASHTSDLRPVLQIGSGSVATQYTHTGLTSYFTFKTGAFATTTGGDGSAQPKIAWTGSWESTELNINAMTNPGIWEFGLGFQLHDGVGSTCSPMLCRYTTVSALTCTTSNQLYITYTVSF